MSIVNCVKTVVLKPLYKFFSALYSHGCELHANIQAIENKDRSLRALNKLDARLLDDVGLCRFGSKILSIDDAKAVEQELQLKAEQEKSVLSKRRLSVIKRRKAIARAKEYELLQKPLE